MNLMGSEKSLDASPRFINAEICIESGRMVKWVTRQRPRKALRLQVGKSKTKTIEIERFSLSWEPGSLSELIAWSFSLQLSPGYEEIHDKNKEFHL